jgi:Tol biopolymer transport system component
VAARRRLRERMGWMVAAVMFLAVLGLGWRALHQPPAAASAKRVTILPPEGANIDDEETYTAISPDGREIAFVATDSAGTSQLWLRDLASAQAHPLPGTEQAFMPFWSPDSRFIGFFADGKLKKVDGAGRNVETLCDAPDGRGGTWSTRGVIVFAPASRSGLSKISQAGGTPTAVTVPDSARGEGGHRFPCFLPDGTQFLYVAMAGVDSLATRLGSLYDRKTSWLLNADGAAIFAAPGHLLFGRNGSLMVQSFDLGRRAVRGEPYILGPAPSVSSYGGSPAASASANGIILQRHRSRPTFALVWRDREGRQIGDVPVAPGSYLDMSLSPDNQRVALIRFRDQGGSDVWTADLGSGRVNRLSDVPFAEKPVWSPDGKWIAFSALASRNRNIYRALAGGAGEPQMYVPGKTPFMDPSGWTKDGHTFLFRDLDAVTGEDVWAMTADGDAKPYAVLHSRFHEIDPTLSPDDHWIAYRSNETGRAELYVQSFPSLEQRARVSTDGAGPQPRSESGKGFWRKDGRELVWIGGDGLSVMSASVETTGGLRIGAPHRLFTLPPGDVSLTPAWDLQRFLVLEPRNTREEHSLQMILDWPAELKGR